MPVRYSPSAGAFVTGPPRGLRSPASMLMLRHLKSAFASMQSEERPAQRLAAAVAALAASALLAATAVPDAALAAGVRLKGTAGPGQGEDKYLGGVDAKRLQSARRKEALAKRCGLHAHGDAVM